jgi:anti-sigma-K factor RskA
MKYDHPQLRDKLAAEYVLGTMIGRVRGRFQRLLKYDAALRRDVAAWEMRLAPLAALASEVTPPARVWRAITARIAGVRRKTGFWTDVGVWRGFAAVSTVLVLMLAAVLVSREPPAEEPIARVAVLANDKSQPAVVISLPAKTPAAQPHLKIKMLTQLELPVSKSFELWMLPGDAQPPVSLGVIKADLTQTIQVTDAASRLLPEISGMAISVEPEGGSKTGLPTGPVILSGPWVRLL